MLVRPLSLTVVALFAACGSAPEPHPLLAPRVDTGIRYFGGSVLTGRQPRPELASALDVQQTRQLHCRFWFVERLPERALQPLSEHTELILSAEGDEALLPISQLGLGARIGVGDEAREFADMLHSGPEDRASPTGRRISVFEQTGILAADVTAVFYARSERSFLSTSGQPVRKLVGLLVSGHESLGDAAHVGIVFEDLELESHGESLALGERRVLRQEIVLLEDRLPADGSPLLLALPALQDTGETTGWVIELRSSPPEPRDATFDAALAHCRWSLRREADEAAQQATQLTRPQRFRRSIEASLRALDLARRHRPGLAFLTQQGGDCPLAQDLALAADDETLAAWVRLLGERPGFAEGAEDTEEFAAPAFAWLFERSAYELLSRRLDRGELTPAQRGMLARHAGEAGVFPGTLAAILRQSNTVDELHERLVEENLAFLGSSEPAARVRAFDWLVRHERAPEGYEPLAERSERRKVLRRFQEQRGGAGR